MLRLCASVPTARQQPPGIAHAAVRPAPLGCVGRRKPAFPAQHGLSARRRAGPVPLPAAGSIYSSNCNEDGGDGGRTRHTTHRADRSAQEQPPCVESEPLLTSLLLQHATQRIAPFWCSTYRHLGADAAVSRLEAAVSSSSRAGPSRAALLAALSEVVLAEQQPVVLPQPLIEQVVARLAQCLQPQPPSPFEALSLLVLTSLLGIPLASADSTSSSSARDRQQAGSGFYSSSYRGGYNGGYGGYPGSARGMWLMWPGMLMYDSWLSGNSPPQHWAGRYGRGNSSWNQSTTATNQTCSTPSSDSLLRRLLWRLDSPSGPGTLKTQDWAPFLAALAWHVQRGNGSSINSHRSAAHTGSSTPAAEVNNTAQRGTRSPSPPYRASSPTVGIDSLGARKAWVTAVLQTAPAMCLAMVQVAARRRHAGRCGGAPGSQQGMQQQQQQQQQQEVFGQEDGNALLRQGIMHLAGGVRALQQLNWADLPQLLSGYNGTSGGVSLEPATELLSAALSSPERVEAVLFHRPNSSSSSSSGGSDVWRVAASSKPPSPQQLEQQQQDVGLCEVVEVVEAMMAWLAKQQQQQQQPGGSYPKVRSNGNDTRLAQLHAVLTRAVCVYVGWGGVKRSAYQLGGLRTGMALLRCVKLCELAAGDPASVTTTAGGAPLEGVLLPKLLGVIAQQLAALSPDAAQAAATSGVTTTFAQMLLQLAGPPHELFNTDSTNNKDISSAFQQHVAQAAQFLDAPTLLSVLRVLCLITPGPAGSSTLVSNSSSGSGISSCRTEAGTSASLLRAVHRFVQRSCGSASCDGAEEVLRMLHMVVLQLGCANAPAPGTCPSSRLHELRALVVDMRQSCDQLAHRCDDWQLGYSIGLSQVVAALDAVQPAYDAAIAAAKASSTSSTTAAAPAASTPPLGTVASTGDAADLSSPVSASAAATAAPGVAIKDADTAAVDGVEVGQVAADGSTGVEPASSTKAADTAASAASADRKSRMSQDMSTALLALPLASRLGFTLPYQVSATQLLDALAVTATSQQQQQQQQQQEGAGDGAPDMPLQVGTSLSGLTSHELQQLAAMPTARFTSSSAAGADGSATPNGDAATGAVGSAGGAMIETTSNVEAPLCPTPDGLAAVLLEAARLHASVQVQAAWPPAQRRAADELRATINKGSGSSSSSSGTHGSCDTSDEEEGKVGQAAAVLRFKAMCAASLAPQLSSRLTPSHTLAITWAAATLQLDMGDQWLSAMMPLVQDALVVLTESQQLSLHQQQQQQRVEDSTAVGISSEGAGPQLLIWALAKLQAVNSEALLLNMCDASSRHQELLQQCLRHTAATAANSAPTAPTADKDTPAQAESSAAAAAGAPGDTHEPAAPSSSFGWLSQASSAQVSEALWALSASGAQPSHAWQQAAAQAAAAKAHDTLDTSVAAEGSAAAGTAVASGNSAGELGAGADMQLQQQQQQQQ